MEEVIFKVPWLRSVEKGEPIRQPLFLVSEVSRG